MATPEEQPPIDWTPYIRQTLAVVFFAELFIVIFSWAEGRPWTSARTPDLLRSAAIAGLAGFILSVARMLLSELLGPKQPDEELDPIARSERRKTKATAWLCVVCMILFCVLMLFFAVAKGTGHGEWVSWIPIPSRGRSRLLF
jgi:xanthine/uracil/vitamin C permease (AzgA family)